MNTRIQHIRFMRGGVLIMVAISLVVFIGLGGLVVDAGIGYAVKAKLNAAVDAASIAASRAVATGDSDGLRREAAITTGTRFYYANFPDNYLGATANAPVITATHQPDGKWIVSVSGSARTPTYLMRIFGVDELNVSATGEAVRRDLDMMLVIDSSGSLDSVFGTVKSAAVQFVNKFNNGAGGDRLGLVFFADGAIVAEPINKTATRGFDKTEIVREINRQNSSGWTASGEAMRRAVNELNAVPTALRSSLRVIVFFSDGAPNTPASVWQRHNSSGQLVGTVVGTLSSGTGGGNPLLCRQSEPCTVYRHDSRSSALGSNYTNINRLPPNAGATFNNLPLTSYNNRRTLSPGLEAANSVTRCNINKIARNMVENIANNARSDGIVIISLGLGPQLNGYENMTGCGFTSAEYGSNILKRIANSSGVDTHNASQPTGIYVYAASATELEAAFNKIASEIIRLSR